MSAKYCNVYSIPVIIAFSHQTSWRNSDSFTLKGFVGVDEKLATFD